jgi:endonuclease/exonuclease/phosphatase family metal-dependent hydrolase
MTTHFDTNPASWLPASQVALEQINRQAGQNSVWLMGDFNCPGSCPAWNHLIQGGFQDAWRQTGHGEEGIFTLHKFSGQDLTQEGRIDWILHRGPWQAQSCVIDRRNKNGFYPSDHFPVSAVYELKV